jgi:hypothetical protein
VIGSKDQGSANAWVSKTLTWAIDDIALAADATSEIVPEITSVNVVSADAAWLAGTATPFAQVDIANATVTLGSVVANQDGNWTFALPTASLGQTHDLTATTVLDATATSAAVTYTPAAPSLSMDNVAVKGTISYADMQRR